MLDRRRENQYLPTMKHTGYITHAVQRSKALHNQRDNWECPTSGTQRDNPQWPITGQGGMTTLASSGVIHASKRRTNLEVTNKWTN